MRKLLAALVVIGGLALANFSTPALATPTNTVFDRTVHGCDYQFKYGSVFGAAYAEVRVFGADPSGIKCRMDEIWTRYVDGGGSNVSVLRGPNGGCGGLDTSWCDNNVWHNNVVTNATGWGADWFISTTKGSGISYCIDAWQLEASIYETYPEGKWVDHNEYDPGCW